MKPKEKAVELVEKYLRIIKWQDNYKEMLNQAKQCALIAVDEVLKQIKPYYILLDGTGFLGPNQNHVEFWLQVKIELEKI